MPTRLRELPWRRRLRFSVRGLMVVTLLIGAWLGSIVRDAQRQRDAVAAIRSPGGTILYDWEWRDRVHNSRRPPGWPRWIVDRLGVDYFGHVTEVSTWNFKNPDRALSEIGKLTRLKALHIPGGLQVSDAGFSHLKSLTSIQSLELPRANLTDARLAQLAGLTRLERLDLGSTPVTDVGLAHLKSFKVLRSLDLTDCQRISDAGLAHLAALPSLEILSLTWCRINGDGLVHMNGLLRLRELFLQGTRVDDKGLLHINRLPNLRVLDLANTAISDSGLANLKVMSTLRSLDVRLTKVTDAGVTDLQRVLPKTKIIH